MTKEENIFNKIYGISESNGVFQFHINKIEYLLDANNNRLTNERYCYVPGLAEFKKLGGRRERVVSKGNTDNHGGYYLCTSLGSTTVRVHRLVAYFLFGDKIFGYEVNHIDGDRTNNKPSNIELCTSKQNSENACSRGAFYRNSRKYSGKITKNVYNKIIKLLKEGKRNCEIRDILGEINVSEISRIRHNKWNARK